MSLNSVNTNVGAMLALQSLNAINRELFTVQNRISTGLKVASAKDAVGEPIWVFTFNASAIPELEQLDPREAIQIELVPPSRIADQSVKRIVLEVGDLRAARAFAMIPQATGSPAPATQTASAAH